MVAFYIEGCPLSKYEDPSWDLEKDQHYSRKSESSEEIFMYSKETGKFDRKTKTGLKTYHDMPILTCVALVAHGARVSVPMVPEFAMLTLTCSSIRTLPSKSSIQASILHAFSSLPRGLSRPRRQPKLMASAAKTKPKVAKANKPATSSPH